MVVRKGDMRWIDAAEVVAINSERPRGNEKMKTWKSAASSRGKSSVRLRPPKPQRKQARAGDGPLDAPDAEEKIYDKMKQQEKEKEQGLNKKRDKERWLEDYATAYSNYQINLYEKTGLHGPVNLYSRRHKRLLMQYAAKGNVELEWDRLQDVWNCNCPAALMLEQVSRLQKRGRVTMASRVLRKGILSHGLPLPKELSVSVESPEMKSYMISHMRRPLSGANYLDQQTKDWMVRTTKVVVKPTRKLGMKRQEATS